MKPITKTVFVSNDGREFNTEAEAVAQDHRVKAYEILSSLDTYWRDTDPEEVANKLVNAGYIVVKLQ